MFRLGTGSRAIDVSGAYVSASTFDVLQLKPSLGTFFTAIDDSTGGGAHGWEAVLGYDYWKTHFAGDPRVIGQYLIINGASVRVVGVLPQQFRGLLPLNHPAVLLPRHFLSETTSEKDMFSQPYQFDWIVLGRRAPGESVERIRSKLNRMESQFRALAGPKGMFASVPRGDLIVVKGGDLGLTDVLESLRAPIGALETLAVLLMVFCFCNVVLLLVCRASRDSNSRAIRYALGANARNESLSSLAEVAGMALAGCAVGYPLAAGISRLLCRVIQSGDGFADFSSVQPNAHLWATGTAVTLCLVCLVDIGIVFRDSGRAIWRSAQCKTAADRSHSRAWIVGFEIAASTMLITMVALDVSGFLGLQARPSGFGVGDSVVLSPDLQDYTTRGGEGSSKLMPKERLDLILRTISRSPGVVAVGTVNVKPLSGATAMGRAYVFGPSGAHRNMEIWPADVSIGYFDAIGTRIIYGRTFSSADVGSAPVCIASRDVAERLLGSVVSIGRYIYDDGSMPCLVVGVAEDAHFATMSGKPDPIIYRLRPATDLPNIVVKGATEAIAANAARAALRVAAPDAVHTQIEPLRTYVSESLREWKLVTVLGAICGSLTAIILGVGIIGVLSVQVSARRHQIGVEIALGASRLNVCLSVLKRYRYGFLGGLMLGVVGSVVTLSELNRIYVFSSTQIVIGYIGSVLVLASLWFVSAFIPMREALAISPRECLVSE